MEQDWINKWTINSSTEDELKKIAKDLYNGIIYTDRHCRSSSDVNSCFMCLMFIGPDVPKSPSYPSENSTLSGKRDNVIYDIVDREIEQKKYDNDIILYNQEYKIFKKVFLGNIGLIYEYLDQAGPTSVNGMPTFFSLKYLNISDAEKMFVFYEKYKEIREVSDNF